jgi:hypothetical protein
MRRTILQRLLHISEYLAMLNSANRGCHGLTFGVTAQLNSRIQLAPGVY